MPTPILRTARWRISRISISQIQTRRYTQPKNSTVRANALKRLAFVSIAGAITAAGIWCSTCTAGFDNVLRLEESLPKLSTAAGSDASKAEVTRRLSQVAYSHKVRGIAGVDRYDGAQLASNNPCEDRFIHDRLASSWNGSSAWMAWAVFDGLAEWQTADLLEKQLLVYVRNSLSNVTGPLNGEADEQSIQDAIIKAFVDLDDSIMKTALSIAERVQPLPEKIRQLFKLSQASFLLPNFPRKPKP